MTKVRLAETPQAFGGEGLHEVIVEERAFAGMRAGYGSRSKASRQAGCGRRNERSILDRAQVWDWKRAVARLPLSAMTRLVACMIIDHQNYETGRCDPSIATLCSLLRSKDGTVRAAIKSLVAVGCMTRTSPRGGSSGSFVFALPPFEGAASEPAQLSPNGGGSRTDHEDGKSRVNPPPLGGGNSPRTEERNHERTMRGIVPKDDPLNQIEVDARGRAPDAHDALRPGESEDEFCLRLLDELVPSSGLSDQEVARLEAETTRFRAVIARPASAFSEAEHNAADDFLLSLAAAGVEPADVISFDLPEPVIWAIVNVDLATDDDDDCEDDEDGEDDEAGLWGSPDYDPWKRRDHILTDQEHDDEW